MPFNILCLYSCPLVFNFTSIEKGSTGKKFLLRLIDFMYKLVI